jgi:maltose alpha-D-glucosyltransferase/alpha-amylase
MPQFHMLLLKLITGNKRINGLSGALEGVSGRVMPRGVRKYSPAYIQAIKSGPYSSSFDFGGDYHFRLYRRLEDGVRPDVEIGTFISDTDVKEVPVPLFAGAIHYRDTSQNLTCGVMTTYVKHKGTAWNLCLDATIRFFEEILSKHSTEQPIELSGYRLFEGDVLKAPVLPASPHNTFWATSALLGKKTAQLHHLLAGKNDNSDFAPEPMSKLYLRSLYQSMRTKTRRVIGDLRKSLNRLPQGQFQYGNAIVILEQKILNVFSIFLRDMLSSMRIRIHGHFGLHQFLNTGSDFVIKDFRGAVDTPITERRLKRSPLRDIAGMLYSYNKLTYTALYRSLRVGSTNQEVLERWADVWFTHNGNLFLRTYIESVSEKPPILFNSAHVPEFLKVYFLEQALTDLDCMLRTNTIELDIISRAILSVLGTKEM